jgi:hypothetical protein
LSCRRLYSAALAHEEELAGGKKEKEVTRQREDKLPKKLLLSEPEEKLPSQPEEKEEAVTWGDIEQADQAWGTWERREQ